MNEKPIPIEESDPEFAELLKRWCEWQAGKTKEFVSPFPEVKKVGRNDPCPCLSGKKFKKCTCLKFHPK